MKRDIIKNQLQLKTEYLQQKLQLLEANALNCKYPSQTRTNIKNFLSELSDIMFFADECTKNVQLVTMSTIEKSDEEADFSTVDFDGEFCKLVQIQKYPYQPVYLLFLSPVEVAIV